MRGQGVMQLVVIVLRLQNVSGDPTFNALGKVRVRLARYGEVVPNTPKSWTMECMP